MKSPLVISLIMVVGLQTFSKMLVILGYEINKDYISQTLCVNRSKPKCCCHEKCYLNKKLKQEENQQGFPGGRTQNDLSHLQYYTENNTGLTYIQTSLTWVPLGLLKSKGNQLIIEVSDVRVKRLIGDEKDPDDCKWLPGEFQG